MQTAHRVSLHPFLIAFILSLAVAPAALAQSDELAFRTAEGTTVYLQANADTDGDGIDNGLEINGFVFDLLSGELRPWDGNPDITHYFTDPLRASTDGDPYSDYMEVTGANMPSSVAAPYNHPLVAARPLISVYMTDYEIFPTAEITDTEGRTINSAYTNSTTNEDQIGGSVTAGFSLSPFELASVDVEASYSHTWSSTSSTTSEEGFEWSSARSVKENEAAVLRLKVYYVNRGSAPASDVRPTISLRLGNKTIATFEVSNNSVAQTLAPGSRYPASGEISIDSYVAGEVDRDITVSLDELKAIQRGAPLSLVVPQVEANIQRWDPATQSFSNEITWADFEEDIDPVSVTVEAQVGRQPQRYQVYVGSPQFQARTSTLRDVLDLIYDVEERGGQTYVSHRAYPDRWYLSTDSEPILDAWHAAGQPADMLGLPIERDTRIILLSPGDDAAPQIDFTSYTPDLRQVYTSSRAVDGFPIQRAVATLYMDDRTVEVPLDAYSDSPFFSNSTPLTDPFYGGFVTVYNARGEARVQELVTPGTTSTLQTCAQQEQYDASPRTDTGSSYPLFMTQTPGVPLWVTCNFSAGEITARPWRTLPDDDLDHRSGEVHVVNQTVRLAARGRIYGPTTSALYRSTDGGQTWAAVPGIRHTILSDIHFVSETQGFAVGLFGALYTTTDAGASWASVRHPLGESAFRAIDFLDEKHGIIVGERGAAMRTSDGGVTWVPMTVFAPGDTVTDYGRLTLGDVAMLALDRFVIVSLNAMLTSVDNGTTWQVVEWQNVTGTSGPLSMRGLDFPTRSTGYAYSNVGMVKTTDGGVSWSEVNMRPSGPVNDTHFFDAQSGIVLASDGRMMHTIDGGLTWEEQEARPSRSFYQRLHFNGPHGLLIGQNSGESEDVSQLYRTDVQDFSVGPGGEAHTIRPKSLLVYYAWPSVINGATTIAEAAQTLGQYDYVVLGEGIEYAVDPNAYLVRRHPAMASTKVFGYVDVGVTTQNLPMQEILTRIAHWDGFGVAGIFLDNFGHDFGVTRERQNEALEMARRAGLPVMVNAWNPDDVFSTDLDPAYNPDGVAIDLTYRDFYFAESYQVQEGDFVSMNTWREKADKLAAYREAIGFNIMSVTTPRADGQYDKAAFHYAWHSALLDGHTAIGWGEPVYSAQSAQAPYRARPDVAPGRTFFTDLEADGPFFRRQTEGGEVRINAEDHTYRFGASTVDREDEAVIELPNAVTLAQNYPNPFRTRTTIPFQIARPGPVTLTVYDVIGRRVAVLVNDVLPTGAHTARFDASGLSSGLYLYRIVSGEAHQTRRMVVVK
ncbi:MAG: YCF48-related protein [Bacteroidota bacterium]